MNPRNDVKARLMAVYEELLRHEGYGSFKVEMRILKRGQKEVIVDCGKQYRFVVDFRPASAHHEIKPGGEASRDIPERTQLTELQSLSA